MDPSRVAGAVAKGRAMEGPALAHASAEGDAPEDFRQKAKEKGGEQRRKPTHQPIVCHSRTLR